MLRTEYDTDSLSGAVLIGCLPYVIYEFEHEPHGGGEYVAFPSDAYFMDLNGEWQKDQCTAPEPGLFTIPVLVA
jgi:hypothetical protein